MTSESAREISEWSDADLAYALALRHGLSFTHNPGGGQFYRTAPTPVDIQVHMRDAEADYRRLLAGLRAAGLEGNTHADEMADRL